MNTQALFKGALIALVCTAALSACAPASNSLKGKIHTGTDGSRIYEAGTLAVVDGAGKPIARAQILIGQSLNNPFSGNFLTTGEDGTIAAPTEWTGPMAITVEAKGYVRTTFFDRAPTENVFKLRRMPANVRYEVRGDTTSYAGLSDGKNVSVGLVFPTFTRGEVPNIDLMSLVSTETDPVTVFGKTFQVPSNMSIPTQSATYIMPITLSKPAFRMILNEPSARRYAVVHVKGVLQDIADDLQGGFSIPKIANKVSFVGGTVKAHSGGQKPAFLSMAVNENAFAPLMTVTAPKFDGKTLNMLAVAVPDWGGVYAISDIKGVAPGAKINLASPRNGAAKGLVVSLLRVTRAKESMLGVENSFFSAAISPSNRSQALDFLDIVKAPEVRADTLVLTPPKAVAGVEKLMTRAVLSTVEILGKDKYKLERKTPQWELYASAWSEKIDLPEMAPLPMPKGQMRWELYASDWTSSMTLPQWPAAATPVPAGQLRWETEFAGVSTAKKKGISTRALDLEMLEKVTHVTRSGLDL